MRLNKTEVSILDATSSPGRFSLALGVGRPTAKARKKRPGNEVALAR